MQRSVEGTAYQLRMVGIVPLSPCPSDHPSTTFLGPLPTQLLAASASELFDPNSQHVLQFSVVCGIGYTKFSFLFATVFALFGDRK